MAMTDERKLLLLGLLRRSDMHGYLLNAHLDCTAPISLKKPTAYNLLDRMEQDGWVKHRDEPTGDRPRRVFSVTRKGERAFLELLRRQLALFAAPELPGLVSLSFLDALEPGEAALLIEQRRRQLDEARRAFARGEGEEDGQHTGSTHLPISFMRRYLELERAFLDEVLAALER